MSIEIKFASFKEKYSLPDSAIDDLKTIFDNLIVEVAHKIINNSEPKKVMPKLDTSPVVYTEKKFATKIAEQYAAECSVTLEEIPSETGKVTKKDIENYVKNKSGSGFKPGSSLSLKLETESGKELEIKKSNSNSKSKITKESNSPKEKCGGVTKDGNPCNSAATKTPEGSKKCYCFRHAIDWKQYEISSDSDDEIEIENEPENPIENTVESESE
jgi:6-pyruvoyl-tetrahydropterin synthase